MKTNLSFKPGIVIAAISLYMLIPFAGSTQQVPHFSQFMFNPYLYNPAIAGTLNHYQIRGNNRISGWYDDAPFSVSAVFTAHLTKTIWLGAYITTDVPGRNAKPTLWVLCLYLMIKDSGLRYPEVFPLADAIPARWHKAKFAKSPFPYDPAIIQLQDIVSPDASVGFYLYSTSFHVGLAATNSMGNA
jgi:hypothetical protein